MKSFLALVAVAVILVSAQITAYADSPVEFATKRHRELVAAAGSGDTTTASKLFDRSIDWDDLAKTALGPNASAFRRSELEEFRGMVHTLLTRSMTKSMAELVGWHVVWHVSNDVTPQPRVKVSSFATKYDEQPIEVSYLLVPRNGVWTIADMEIEGVSLAHSYQSQFNRVIKKEGVAVLLQKMRARVAKSEN
jgi:phospholipid transport system substrate-binding protein